MVVLNVALLRGLAMIGSKEDPRLVYAQDLCQRAYLDLEAAEAQLKSFNVALDGVIETLDKEKRERT
jgi:hypothetical protein